MRFRMEVRLDASDVGSRVVVRWRRPAEGSRKAERAREAEGSREAEGAVEAEGSGEEVADVLGILEAADDSSFTVRKASGEVVTIPRERALAGKTVPPAPGRRSTVTGRSGGASGLPQPPSDR